MFNTFELVSFSFAIVFMAVALYLLQVRTSTFAVVTATQQVAGPDIVFVGTSELSTAARTDALLAATEGGALSKLVVDDVQTGTGRPVVSGDSVSVHYIGTLQNGLEFDNSYNRGQAFEFTVGAGQVITGWDEGLIGMQVGGKRILVIPAAKAYGTQQVGPIPPNSTLVFAIELIAIK